MAGEAFELGLVSVTFRGRSPENVVGVAAGAGLSCVEWGGDVHVPAGDAARARAVARLTADAGLRVAAYGSYLRLGEGEDAGPVLDSAAALGAPAVRVWAGRRGSADADDGYRAGVIEDARTVADRAAKIGAVVCLEHHGGTLTDTDASAVGLLRAIGHPNVRTLWQPHADRTVDDRCAGLRDLLPWLHHVHVFHWPAPGVRADLADGADAWRAYLDVLRAADARVPLLLEFVRDDDPEQLARDATALRTWIARDLTTAKK